MCDKSLLVRIVGCRTGPWPACLPNAARWPGIRRFCPPLLTLPCAVQADCDWDGVMNRTDFLGVGQEILKNSCDQMDDVKAAFRVFDSNDNGSISKEELREAMVNLGQRCTEE